MLTVVDRRDAIYKAVREAAAGDLVLIAGKGTYQEIGGRTLPFDDVAVARGVGGPTSTGAGWVTNCDSPSNGRLTRSPVTSDEVIRGVRSGTSSSIRGCCSRAIFSSRFAAIALTGTTSSTMPSAAAPAASSSGGALAETYQRARSGHRSR